MFELKVKKGAIHPSDAGKLSLKELKENIIKLHPISIYNLSIGIFNKEPNKKEEALFWYYVGALRYRIRLEVIGSYDDRDPEMFYFNKIEFEYKPILLEWAKDDINKWINSIKKAIEWNKNNDNYYTDRVEYKNIENNIMEEFNYLIKTLKEIN